MPEPHVVARPRRLLRTAWALPAAFLLLCSLQLGWLERFGFQTAGAGPAAAPAYVSVAGRDLTTDGGGLTGGVGGDSEEGKESTKSDERNGRLGQPRRCQGPFYVPKVALMFLVRGPIHHEHTWAAWLEDAAGLVPTVAAVSACCGSDKGNGGEAGLGLSSADSGTAAIDADGSLSGSSTGSAGAEGAAGVTPRELRRSFRRRSLLARRRAVRQLRGGNGSSSGGGSVLAAQRLFSVYVHPAPGYAPYPAGHAFHGRELQQRVKVAWGKHSVTEAMRLLLTAAFADPANQRFQFVDETTLPLYPPHLLWAQFMAENRTRMSACQASEVMWVPALESDFLKPHMWRKSSQWSMILRRHAEPMVADTAVWDAITPACLAQRWLDPATNTSTFYPCVSDEHYLPTVLAAAGFSNETTCFGNAMHVDWARRASAGSPHTYWQQDATLDEFDKVRGQLGKCDFVGATSDANLPGNFETTASLGRFRCPAQHRPPHAARAHAMVRCSLLSRKWAPSTADLMFAALSNASRPSGVLRPRQPGHSPLEQSLTTLRKQGMAEGREGP